VQVKTGGAVRTGVFETEVRLKSPAS
jgi:hypothetical protein